jgi:F0F1-type ATP synthase assembly protein I
VGGSVPRLSSKSLQLASFGLEMGVAVVIGIGGGYYLDSWLGTGPLFFWLGFVLGMGAAVKAVVDAVKLVNKDKGTK